METASSINRLSLELLDQKVDFVPNDTEKLVVYNKYYFTTRSLQKVR